MFFMLEKLVWVNKKISGLKRVRLRTSFQTAAKVVYFGYFRA